MTYRWRIRIYVIFYVDMVLRAVTYGCHKMNKAAFLRNKYSTSMSMARLTRQHVPIGPSSRVVSS